MDNFLLDSIERVGLPHWPELYKSLGKPSIRVKTFTFEADAPIGVSRFGGEPDLPMGTKWPTYSGHSLPFVAQICLSEAAPFDKDNCLPRTGMLYFFYDIINTPSGYDLEEQAWRVMFFEHETGNLRRTPLPNDLIGPGTLEVAQLIPCGMLFSSEVTFPKWTDPECKKAFYYDDQSRYEQVLRYKVQQSMADKPLPIEVFHRIGGYPDALQPTDMLREVNNLSRGEATYQEVFDSEEVEIDRSKWVLLLQVDSDNENSDMFWGDNGRLYFWIKKEELQARNFDYVQLLLQSL